MLVFKLVGELGLERPGGENAGEQGSLVCLVL